MCQQEQTIHTPHMMAGNVHAHVSELIQVTITSPIIKGKLSTPAQFPSYRITCEFLNKNDTYY